MSSHNNFFDNYSDFYKSSKTTPIPNRLNSRYRALIANNHAIIENSTILDIASHDGRWSFAAIKNNAKFVLGIEARKYLVEYANKNMKNYGISNKKYRFIVADIHKEIQKLSSRKFDVVFCFGFFYHTIGHYSLLLEIKRLNPKYLILDTGIATDYKEPVIKIYEEESDDESRAVQNELIKNKKVLVGLPSRGAMELMLTNLGFSFEYYEWHNDKILDWNGIEDYYNNQRVSLVAKNLSHP